MGDERIIEFNLPDIDSDEELKIDDLPTDPRYPASLIKASYDTFFYGMKLTTGEYIEFCSADINGDYVTIYTNTESESSDFSPYIGKICDRGLDVRIDQIVWCGDAPNGH